MPTRSSRAGKEDLEWLKEQPEWDSVIAYFREQLESAKTALVRSGMTSETLVVLNAKGGIINEFLQWAKKRPKKGEAQE